jgi:hypothetical protein
MKNGKAVQEMRRMARRRLLAFREQPEIQVSKAVPRRVNLLFLLAHLSQWEPVPVRVN